MIECIVLTGLFYIAGTDINGDPYFANVDMIVSVTEDLSIRDTGIKPRTMITTLNGIIVEDLPIFDVAVGMSSCEGVYNDLTRE
jgi:hypothetical protein